MTADEERIVAWTSDNTSEPPPATAPRLRLDTRTELERMKDEFRELQRRGW